MRFNSDAQEQEYKKAMKRTFKAAAFDIDGTLTELGRPGIPEYLEEAFAALPSDFPLAICSGRDLAHIQKKILEIQHKNEYYRQKEEFFIFSENGCHGHVYDAKKDKFKELFRLKWPDDTVLREEMSLGLKSIFSWHKIIHIRDASLVIRFPSFFYIWPSFIRSISAITRIQTEAYLKKNKFDKHFSVQDSGIGCIIIPESAGKGKAIEKWSKYLKISLRDILVVGDKAEKGGNDEEFLSGLYGTAFTVGRPTKNIYPLPVFDENGQRSTGPRGTYNLLQQAKFQSVL